MLECPDRLNLEKCKECEFCEEYVDFFVEKVKAKIFKIPVANKSLEPVREGTTMGQIPENVSTSSLFYYSTLFFIKTM